MFKLILSWDIYTCTSISITWVLEWIGSQLTLSFLHIYLVWWWIYNKQTGPEVDKLAELARKNNVYLVMGAIEKDGYTLYCTALFFNSEGRFLGKHRKVMPTSLERCIWGFGDGSTIPVYDTPIGKLGAAICWENRMPLYRTALYGKG